MVRTDSFPKDENVEGSYPFYILITNKFNLHFIEGSFEEGLPLIEEVLKRN